MRMVLRVCAVGVLALIGTTGAAARSRPPAHKPPTTQAIVLKAIANAAAKGHLDPSSAAADRAAVTRAARLIPRLPAARRGPLRSSLDQAAAVAGKLTGPRAAAVFGQLAVNVAWFARHGPPPPHTDITDGDGVVYRYFGGSGFEFHPLANFGALNADIARKDVAATARLADALIARGVPRPGAGTVWEYYFNYSGGRAPWLSGFAQSVAAQAFARAASLVPDDAPRLLAEAHSAFAAIPGRLVRTLTIGPWIKLYSFSGIVVLNAQLQSAISLAGYASITSDTRAGTLANELRTAAARGLPRFDTGFWTYYSLPRNPSPLDYQEYVVQLLKSLSHADSRFAVAAAQFASYQTRAPAFRLGDAGPGAVEFWVSKPSVVRISALGDVRRLNVLGGWHDVSWKLPSRAGIFPVTIHATDWAGNSATASALPIVRVASAPKPKPRPKKHPTKRTTAASAAAAVPAASIPPQAFVAGAGLDQPSQGSLAQADGLGAARMTLVWPAGASTPDPGALAALGKLPSGTSLVLDLWASPLPADDAGRAALASYAAAVAQQVPTLHDLVLGPAPGSASAAVYVAALSSVYDAVKAVAPAVRVDGDLDGTQAPKAALAALAAAYRTSGRPFPLLDALAFHPAPAAGKSLWALGDLSKLTAALATGFNGTSQAGATLPLLIDDVAVESTIPATEASLYGSPGVASSGIDEAAQAAAYSAALQKASCSPTVAALLFHRLVDSSLPGEQSGLYYPDGTAKTSFAPVVQAAAAAQSSARSCGPAPKPPAQTTTTSTTPTTTTATTATTATTDTTTTTTSTPPPATPPPAGPVAAPGALAFPGAVSRASARSVRIGCTRNCLYLVALQRARDGAPVLARRGELHGGTSAAVQLPRLPIPAGSYRFSVWLVSQSDPGPVEIERSGIVGTT